MSNRYSTQGGVPRGSSGATNSARNSILSTLQATSMIDSKPTLPAEILAAILDFLPVADQLRFARTARRMREMVYDDTRWVARLHSMGCWDETAARRHFEEAMRRRHEAANGAADARTAAAGAAGARAGSAADGAAQQKQGNSTTTLFDAAAEEQRQKNLQQRQQRQQQQKQQQQMSELRDGFETMSVAGSGSGSGASYAPPQDTSAVLEVLASARSIRGHARQEYGRIYGALAPFYYDLVRARSHSDPVLFRVFRDPETQARMLVNLREFARSDWAAGWRDREQRLAAMTGVFEGAVLREFEQGYEFWDVEGRMRRYAHVLDVLSSSPSRSGGASGNSSNSAAGSSGSAGGSGDLAVDLFVSKHPLFADAEVLAQANSMDCINQAPADSVTLEPSRQFFDLLERKLNGQTPVVARIFPRPEVAFWALVDKVREDLIAEYATTLFDESHERSLASYLKAVSGLFEQCLQFFRALDAPGGTPTKEKRVEHEQRARRLALKVFEPHLDLYLQEELDFFTRQAESQVAGWEKQLSEQDASVESFYMANFNRQADKKDFLGTFKKVVMMPVTVLPTTLGLPIGSPFAPSKPANGTPSGTSPMPSRPQTPGLGPVAAAERKTTPLPDKAPRDELAAKAALMTSRLEGIRSLFSIEVALNLVHAAKTSLGRAAVFIALGGQAGEEAREQCATIFVVLLRILGNRHVKSGFERALEHLSQYNPREVSGNDGSGSSSSGSNGASAAAAAAAAAAAEGKGVAPLVTFIELVNVGDLISQMIDVFYEQQVAGPKISDRNDFLDPASLAKKKFEQMLDESVAAGLNKGIDVLMDEVEFICATTQLPTDYNPLSPEELAQQGEAAAAAQEKGADADIGPTPTARRVVQLVSSHTGMLVGSTDKQMLDVFNGEVGQRLFGVLCKHLKRQRVSTTGAIKLIADTALYFDWARSLRNPDLLAFFRALRELSQIYLIDATRHARDMAAIIADGDRFGGVFRAEEVYEFAERRADWYQVKRHVERAMYGLECAVM